MVEVPWPITACCVMASVREHSTLSVGFLLELARDGAIFLPSLEKMTVSGGKPQESKHDKSVWLRLSLWLLVNQKRTKCFPKDRKVRMVIMCK